MKVTYNNKEFGELSEIQKKVIQNDIPQEIFDDDMTRRCKYIIETPCEKYVHNQKDKLIKKLKDNGSTSIPINNIALGVKYAETFPCKCSYADLTDVTCTVGTQSFIHSKDHRIIWRKSIEGLQENKDDAAYKEYEENKIGTLMFGILEHKYERCMARLKLKWLSKLEANGMTEIPIDDDELAKLIFSQSDYKSRSDRKKSNK